MEKPIADPVRDKAAEKAENVKRRKQLLINEHFQFHFIAFTGATAIAACIIFYGASAYFFGRYTSYAIEAGLRPSDPFFKVLSNMENLLMLIFGFTSIAVILFSTIAGLIFSNKIAGPLHRMRGHFERVARGETLEDMRFRDNDYFHEVSVAYNQQMDFLRKRLGTSSNAGVVATDNSAVAHPFKKAS